MLADDKEVYAKRRITLHVADPDKEGKESDHVAEEHDEIEDKESSAQIKSQREFTNSSDDASCPANRFVMK